MFTKKMYEEMMVQRHGDWADFFMNNLLQHHEMHGDDATANTTPSTLKFKPAILRSKTMEAV